jgi:hypothetical protein
MLAAHEYADKPFGSSGLLLTPSTPTAMPIVQPPLIPPAPWSENYIPENDEPVLQPEAEAVETEPPPRPKFPPPPWAKPEAVEEEPGRYPPPQRGEP